MGNRETKSQDMCTLMLKSLLKNVLILLNLSNIIVENRGAYKIGSEEGVTFDP